MSTLISNRRLRILHIILALKPTNGQYNEHVLPMLHKREITVLTYFKSIWGISPPPGVALFEGDDSFIGFLRACRAALRAKEYDAIHVHTPHAAVLLLVTLLLSGLFRKLKPATVHTIQNSFQNFKLHHKLMLIPGFAFPQQLVFCSRASYESFPPIYKWLAGKRTHVVQNAVDLDRVDHIMKAATLAKDDFFTMATVGLIKMKNPMTVLAAFRQCPDRSTKLVFIGEGNLRTELSHAAEDPHLKGRVELTGLIERDRVFDYFVRADLFVSASWGEGLPVAVLEAMACRLPVILSDIPPHREIAEGADFIPLVEAGDAAGLAREITRYMEMPASERARIGQRCRKLIEARFSLPAMHAGYDEIYAQIVGKRSAWLFETTS